MMEIILINPRQLQNSEVLQGHPNIKFQTLGGFIIQESLNGRALTTGYSHTILIRNCTHSQEFITLESFNWSSVRYNRFIHHNRPLVPVKGLNPTSANIFLKFSNIVPSMSFQMNECQNNFVENQTNSFHNYRSEGLSKYK